MGGRGGALIAFLVVRLEQASVFAALFTATYIGGTMVSSSLPEPISILARSFPLSLFHPLALSFTLYRQ